MDAGRFLLPWLEQNDEVENEEGMKIFTPIGPWLKGNNEADTERLMFIGELMRQNSKVRFVFCCCFFGEVSSSPLLTLVTH